jgi:hypothetical protein
MHTRSSTSASKTLMAEGGAEVRMHRPTETVRVDNATAVNALIVRCGCEERGSGEDGSREIEAAQRFQT